MGLSPKKIALVTGANKGLGFEINRQQAQQDIKVVMAIRDSIKGQIAVEKLLQTSLDVEFQYLDVTNIESIKLVYSYLERTYGKLDILVNNAGVCLDGEQKPSEIR